MLIFSRDITKPLVQFCLLVNLIVFFEILDIFFKTYFLGLNKFLKLITVCNIKIFCNNSLLRKLKKELFLKKVKTDTIHSNFEKGVLLVLLFNIDHILKVNTWTRTRNFQSHNLALYQLSYTYLNIFK
jgi:hypothetical protein